MKTADYKLPSGVHPSLEPIETGRTPSKIVNNTETGNKPIYGYKVIPIREAETLAEFGEHMVDQDKPEEHVLRLAQGQYDIIAQRKIREAAASQEVSDMLDGKHDETKDLSEDDRVAYVMEFLKDIGDNYRYGSRQPSAGGGSADAKKALAEKKAVAKAVAENPEIAALQAELSAKLAALGVALFSA